MERLKEQKQIIKSFLKDCLFSINVAMDHNVLRLMAGGSKRLECSRLTLGAVSWCVSLWAGSVCFCSFLRREEKNNCFDLQ